MREFPLYQAGPKVAIEARSDQKVVRGAILVRRERPMQLRTIVLASLALAASLGNISAAAGQAYPSRAITMIVPQPAGGALDALARIFAEDMRATLGQPVIVENVGGAAGTIGVGRVARASPDGYPLGIGTWSTYVANGAIYQLPYDLLNDFEPVAVLPNAPLWIVGNKSLPANDLKTLIAWLKDSPDKASAGVVGLGGSGHICGILFQSGTGTRFQFVPYRGGPQSLQDLVSGQVKAYAVMAKTRWFAAPDVPTVDEAGTPGIHLSAWSGFWAPKGTPKSV